ncbi:MAG TPA: hypothetical protein VHM19_14720 [Polyangiales bacterium]|nr:hypothetical protein [Polyangiales bacterium]
MPRWLPLAMTVGVLGWAPPLAAQGLTLQWDAPAGCPDGARMRARIERMLSHGAQARQELLATARIEADAQGYRLQLDLVVGDHHAERELHDPDCESLSAAGAWLIGLAVDPNLPAAARDELAKEKEPTAASTAPEGAKPAPEAKAAEPAKPAADKAEKAAAAPAAKKKEPERTDSDTKDSGSAASEAGWSVRPGLFGGVFAAGLAGPAVSLGAQVAIRYGFLSIAPSFAHQLARTGDLAGNASAEVGTEQFALQACGILGRDTRGGLCLGAALLRSHASTEGVSQGHGAGDWWATVGVGLLGEQHLYSLLEAFVSAEVFVPVTSRPSFEVGTLGTAGRAARVGGQVRAGLQVRIP